MPTPNGQPRSPTVSVVVSAYTHDRWNDLVDLVRSLEDQSTPPLEIVVVCDHNPSLLERVRAGLGGVVAVENRQQRGLSGARNTGVAVARGDVIAFLDDDAVAAPDWLEHLRAAYEDARVLGVGGAIEPLWEDGRPGWFPEEFDWVVGCTYRGVPESAAAVRNFIGANMSLRRVVFDSVGGFRSSLGRIGTRPLAGEETELCIRARRRWPDSILLYEPRARVLHRVPASRARWRYFRSRCYSEGLSKAVVSRLAGARDGLETERSYTLRTLPRGVARGVGDMLLRRDPTGVARAQAIVAGLAITTAGYVVGTASSARRVERDGAAARREDDFLLRAVEHG